MLTQFCTCHHYSQYMKQYKNIFLIFYLLLLLNIIDCLLNKLYTHLAYMIFQTNCCILHLLKLSLNMHARTYIWVLNQESKLFNLKCTIIANNGKFSFKVFHIVSWQIYIAECHILVSVDVIFPAGLMSTTSLPNSSQILYLIVFCFLLQISVLQTLSLHTALFSRVVYQDSTWCYAVHL